MNMSITQRQADPRESLNSSKLAQAAFKGFLEHAPLCHWHTPKACMLLFQAQVQELVNRLTTTGKSKQRGMASLDEVAEASPAESAAAVMTFRKGCDSAAIKNTWAPPEPPVDWDGPKGMLTGAKQMAKHLMKAPNMAALLDGSPGSKPSANEQRCSLVSCGKMGKHAKCGRCKSAFYCCPNHQAEHWKKGHKAECAEFIDSKKRDVMNCDEEFDALATAKRVSGLVPKWDPASHRSVDDLNLPPTEAESVVPPPRDASVDVFIIYHPMSVDKKQIKKLRAGAKGRTQYFLYDNYKPESLERLLNASGGVVLVTPGAYNSEKLGIPQLIGKNLEVIGVNGASRSSVTITFPRGSHWGFTVGGIPADKKHVPGTPCWFLLSHVTLKVGVHTCGEGAVVVRPGFTGFGQINNQYSSVLASAALYDVALEGDGSLDGAICVYEDGLLAMEQCAVVSCPGAAVMINSGASAELVSCELKRNGKGIGVDLIRCGELGAVTLDRGARSVVIRRTAFVDNEGHALMFTKPREDTGGGGGKTIDKATGEPASAGMRAAMRMSALSTGLSYEELVRRLKEKEDAAPAPPCVVRLAADNTFSRNGRALEPGRQQNAYSAPALYHGPNTAIGAALIADRAAEEKERLKKIGGKSETDLLLEMMKDFGK